MAGAEKAVAWIIEGCTGCKVIRIEKGKFNEHGAIPDMPLYPGDIVFKKDNIKSVITQCLPYVKVQVEEPSRLTIIMDAPEDKKTIIDKFVDWLGLAKTKYKDVRGTSRGAFDHEAVSLENASLLSGQTIFLDDYCKGKTLVFKRLDGKEVFRNTFKGDLELNPGQAGLEPGQIYIREIKIGETLDFRSTIRVLGKEDEKIVNKALAKIDREKVSPEEKIIKKAAYLQFISDLYPAQVDLYWYSYQLLDKAEIKDEKLLDLHEILLGCCLAHKTGGIMAVDFALLENQPGCLVSVELTRDDKTDFVAPDFPFKDVDIFSLYFQVNFVGYCVVLHDNGTQTGLAFPADGTGCQIKPGTGYRFCSYQFDDKPGIETYLFILSGKPLEEMEQYGKLTGNREKCGELNPDQHKFLAALSKKVKEQGQKIDLEIIGSKSFAKLPGKSFKGITWFQVFLEN